MQTCLWFNTEAEEAAKFYTGLFSNSVLGQIVRYGDTGPGKPGPVMTAEFKIDGHSFIALNGGANHPFTASVSFMIYCDTQSEIDRYWSAILDGGGSEMMCGWITDGFGVTWQIVPNLLKDVMSNGDLQQREAVMKEFMTMKKFDIARLEAARDNA